MSAMAFTTGPGSLNGIDEKSTCDEVLKAFNDSGFDGLKQTLMKIRHDGTSPLWSLSDGLHKGAKLDVGVVGSTGSGKSSLVNSLIGIDDSEEGAAQVGVTETTNIRKRYTSRRHSGLYIWDVPGVGTQQHPRKTYLEQQKILTFDLVIVISRSRFTEDDAWLVGQLQQHDRFYYFVRTYIDNDITTQIRRQKVQSGDEGRIQHEVMRTVRQDCLQKLRDVAGYEKPERLFLVCSFDFDEYDFPKLWENLIGQDTLSSKLHAVKWTIRSAYTKTLEEKKERLQKNILADATPSALMSAIPVPGLGLVGDLAYIRKVFNDYRISFGIDEDSLTKNADAIGTDMAELKKDLNLRVWDVEFTVEGIVKLMPYRSVAFFSKFVPLIGSLVAAGINYSATFNLLHEFLNMVHKDALKVHEYMLKKLIQ